MRYYAVILFALLILVGCSPRIVPAQRDTVTVTRTEVIEKLRDTVVFLPIPEGSASSSGQIRDTADTIETSVAVSGVEIVAGTFRHWLKNKPAKIKSTVTVKDKEAITDRNNKILVRDIQYVEKPLKWYDQGFIWAGRICCLAAILWTIFLYIRRKV